MDLYTSINSCRNLRTTVKWVFHEKKKKNTKREWENNSERYFLQHFKSRNSILQHTKRSKSNYKNTRHLWIILWWKSKIFQEYNRYTFFLIINVSYDRLKKRNFNSKPMSKGKEHTVLRHTKLVI